MKCPNKSLPEWKKLEESLGIDVAYQVYATNNFEVPSLKDTEEIIKLYNPEKSIELDEKLTFILNKLGINVNSVNQITDNEGNAIDAIAKADMLKNVIEVVEFKKGITTLPEETAHFIVEMLPDDNVFLKAALDNISSTKTYEEVKNQYWDAYKGDVNKLKKEAIGKLVADHILQVNGENIIKEDIRTVNKFKQWLDNVLKWFARLVGKNQITSESITQLTNPYRQIAVKILTEDFKDLKSLEEINKIPNEFKESIDFIFNQNPQLYKIGSKNDYYLYINTIFPESKYKNIVFHYTNSNIKFNKFDLDKIGTSSLRSQDLNQGFSFVDNKKIARAFGTFNTEIYSIPKDVWETLDEDIYSKYDKNIITALINPVKEDWKSSYEGWKEFMIKNSDNIYILGSDIDLVNFKNFIYNNENKNFFYELDDKFTKQNEVNSKIEEIKSRLKYNLENKEYYFDGNVVMTRVSSIVSKYKKKLFGKPSIETEESNAQRLGGIIVHSYFSTILKNLYEGKNLSQSEYEKQVISELTKLQDFTNFSQNQLKLQPVWFKEIENSAQKLLKKFQDTQDKINKDTNTNGKFILHPEVPIYSESKDLAGTIDLLVVYSNGKGSIYDYKGMNLYDGKREMPNWRINAFDLQVYEYSKILEEYGINGFVETRIIPVNLQTNPINNTISKVLVGSDNALNPDLPREYLEEIPVNRELTGVKVIDSQLEKMFALKDQLSTTLEASNFRNKTVEERLTNLNEAIKKLQLYQDFTPLYNDVKDMVELFEHKKTLPDKMTIEQIEEFYQYFSIYDGFFTDMIENIDEENPNKEKIQLASGILAAKLRTCLTDLSTMKGTAIYEKTGIDIEEPVNEESGLGLMFKKLSEFARGQFRALSKIVRQNSFSVREHTEEVIKDIESKIDALQTEFKNKGDLKAAYEMMYNKQKGTLYSKFSNVYFEERNKASEEKNIKWFLDNTNIEKTESGYKFKDEKLNERLDEFRKNKKEELENRYPSKSKKSQELKDKKYREWEEKYDITTSPSAIFNVKNKMIFAQQNDRFLTPEYRNIKSNKALNDFYETLLKYNREFAEITGKDIDDYFVAEIKSDLIDRVSNVGLSALGGLNDYIKNTLTIEQEDVVGVSIDPTTGKPKQHIPLFFSSQLTRNLTKKEYSDLRTEVLKKYSDENSKEFKEEYAKQIEFKRREKGIQLKSGDLGRSLILFAQSAYTYKYASESEALIKALKESLEQSTTNVTDIQGNKIVNKFTNKVVKMLGVPQGEVEAFEKYMNLYLYGIKYQNKDFSLGKKEEKTDEFGNVIQEESIISGTKAIKGVMDYVSAKALALNLIAGVGNTTGIFANLAFKASEKQYFSKKEKNEALKTLVYGNNHGDKDKAWLLGDYFAIESHDHSYRKANDVSVGKLSKIFTSDNLFMFMNRPDEFMDKVITTAMLKYYGIDKTDNKIKRLNRIEDKSTKSLFDKAEIKEGKINIEGLSNDEFMRFRLMMQKASSSIKGSISQDDQNLIGTNIYSALFMQFRNWIPAMFQDRFKGLSYDEDLADFNMGRFRAFGQEFMTKGVQNKLLAFIDSVGEIGSFGLYNRYNTERSKKNAKVLFDKFKKENPQLIKGKSKQEIDKLFEEYIEFRKNKIAAAAKELRTILMLVLAMMLAKGFKDDDDKQGYIARTSLKLIRRAYLETSFFVDPSSVTTILSSPVVSFRVFTDLEKWLKNTKDETTDLLFGETSANDPTYAGYYTMKQIPVLNPFAEIFDVYNTNLR